MLPEAQTTTQAKKSHSKGRHPNRWREKIKKQKRGFLSSVNLAEKFDVTVRTIDRWEAAGIIPRAKRINKRRYWDEDTEPRVDDAAAAQIAAE